MKKRLFIFLAAAMVVFACGLPGPLAPTFTPPPPTLARPTIRPTKAPFVTVTPVCISAQPTQNDIDRALSYSGGIFDEAEWDKSYTVSENRVSVTWLNNPQGAVVYLEVLIFPCSYEEPDLNNYYSDENWKTIFQNYEGYEMVDECKTNAGLRLYEFKTQNLGFDYGVKYWVENDTDTRVISTMIVFPIESKSMLDDYASRFFPTYKSCP